MPCAQATELNLFTYLPKETDPKCLLSASPVLRNTFSVVEETDTLILRILVGEGGYMEEEWATTPGSLERLLSGHSP